MRVGREVALKWGSGWTTGSSRQLGVPRRTRLARGGELEQDNF